MNQYSIEILDDSDNLVDQYVIEEETKTIARLRAVAKYKTKQGMVKFHTRTTELPKKKLEQNIAKWKF